MAKARGGSIPNQLRWGSVTIPDLEEKIEIMEKHAAALKAIVDQLGDLGLDEIRVDSVTKFDRANDLLTTYQAKVEMAVVQAKWKKK